MHRGTAKLKIHYTLHRSHWYSKLSDDSTSMITKIHTQTGQSDHENKDDTLTKVPEQSFHSEHGK